MTAPTITINGRTYELTEHNCTLPNLVADLIARGFDGTIWNGVSQPVGRQRKTLYTLAYRTAAGEFVTAV
jgi:hypothetical protein